MVRKIILLAILVLGLAAAAAPAAEGGAVAVIDGTPVIPSADLLYFYRAQFPEGEAVTEAEVAGRLTTILSNLLTGEVLRKEAEAKGYGDDPTIKGTLADGESQYLRTYYGQKLAASVSISEDEVKAFYEKARTRRLHSFITADTEEQANAALAELAAGRPWPKVLDKYSTFKDFPNKERTWPAPLSYGGDPLTEAIFALKPGEHTGVIPDAYGLTWSVYKSVKIVHGDGRSYEQACDDIIITLRALETRRRIEELVTAVKDTAPITRDQHMWDEIMARPLEDLNVTYRGKGAAVASVGGVPVPFDGAFDAVLKSVNLGPAEIEKLRQDRPDRYAAVWDGVIKQMEGDAVLEYQARAEGALDDPDIKRAFAVRRTDLLIQKLYENDFLPKVPVPTDEEIQQYYEAHKADFYEPERVEVYLAAMPKEKDLRKLYKAVKGGADMVVTGEARSRARAEASDAMAEAPPPIPPDKDFFFGTITILATPPPGGESPLATELRPRALPLRKLNEPSEVFRLADGRWAFYMPIYHADARQHGLDEPEPLYYSRKAIFTARIEASDKEAAAWLGSLRAKHTVAVDGNAFERLAASLAVAPPPPPE